MALPEQSSPQRLRPGNVMYRGRENLLRPASIPASTPLQPDLHHEHGRYGFSVQNSLSGTPTDSVKEGSSSQRHAWATAAENADAKPSRLAPHRDADGPEATDEHLHKDCSGNSAATAAATRRES